MVSGLHCDLHNLWHYKMKRAEISREVWYGFPNSCWQHKEYKQRPDKMWNGFSSKAGISPSLHWCRSPYTTDELAILLWPGQLMPAGRNGTSQNLIGWDTDTTLQTQPKTEFSHLESGATWSLESLTFQGPLLFLLWSFHYCKVYVKTLLL